MPTIALEKKNQQTKQTKISTQQEKESVSKYFKEEKEIINKCCNV
jgi:hypothetical protein